MHRPDSEAPTAVSILSSNCLLRLGLQQSLEQERGMQLVGYAVNSIALGDLLERARPDVIIVDAEIAADLTAIIQQIRRAHPPIWVILLSGLLDRGTQQAIELGVDGIVLKEQPSAVVIATINHLMQSMGGPSRQVGNNVEASDLINDARPLSGPAGPTSATRRVDGLTERECQIIRCVSQGLSNKDIGNQLCISTITVRHHLTNIFDKLGVPNRQKLLIHAHQYGIAEVMAKA
jgi:DNA-binding NarL/FixJ family response regulator